MEFAELIKLLGPAGDRVVLLAMMIYGIRYLARRNEEQREQLVKIYLSADERAVQIAEMVATCKAVLERVEKKL